MNIKDLISPYIGSRYQKTGEIILTESQLKAIIKEASQPLVEARDTYYFGISSILIEEIDEFLEVK